MMGLDKVFGWIRDLKNEWAFVVRDIDIKESFGWVGVDVNDVGFFRNRRIRTAITTFCQRMIKSKRINIGLYPGENK